MYPLALLSVVSLTLILERFYFYGTRKYNLQKTLQRLSFESTESKTKNPLERVTQCYCSHLSKGETHCINVGQREASRQINAHERGLKALATIGAIAPLIGLLGTVWGMVNAFSQIAELSDNVSPSDFAAGIWTGLLTTVAGLLVAIPAVFAARLFESKVDNLTQTLNELASHLKESYFTTNTEN